MTSELITLQTSEIDGTEQQTVNARELHGFLEVKTEFKDWIARRIKDFGFVENSDFCSFLSESSGGRPSREYHLSLNMAKELSMVERNAKGKQARQYFINCERKLKEVTQQPAIPQTLPDALRLAADLAEKNQQLLEQQKVDAPKVDFADQVVADGSAMTITKGAKVIGYPPRKLKDYIRQIGWLYSGGDTPMQSAITSGYMVLRYAHYTDSNGNNIEKAYPHVTPKGLFALYKRLRKEGKIARCEQLELAN